MAGSVGETVERSFIEVPNINETGFYNMWGSSGIAIGDSYFLSTVSVSLITTERWSEQFREDFNQTREVIGGIEHNGVFGLDRPYKAALNGIYHAVYGLRNNPDNPTNGLLDEFRKRIATRWKEDVRQHAASLTERLQALDLKPWALLQKIMPREETDDSSPDVRWLAKVVGVEVDMIEPEKQEDKNIYGMVPTQVLNVKDLNGATMKVTPPLLVSGLLIKIR